MDQSKPHRSRSQSKPIQPTTLAQKQSAFVSYLAAHFPLPPLYTCQVCHSALPTQNLMCPSCSQTYCTNCIQTALTNTQKCPNCKQNSNIEKFVKNRMLGNLVEAFKKDKQKWKSRLCDFHPDQELTVLCQNCDLLAWVEWVCCKWEGHKVEIYEGEFGEEVLREVEKLREIVGEAGVTKEKLEGIQKILKERYENIMDYKERIAVYIDRHAIPIFDTIMLVESKIEDIDEEIGLRNEWIKKLEEKAILNNNLSHKIDTEFESFKKEIDDIQCNDYNQVKCKIVDKLSPWLGYYIDHELISDNYNSKIFWEQLEKNENIEFTFSDIKLKLDFDSNGNATLNAIWLTGLHDVTRKIDISVKILDILPHKNKISRKNSTFTFSPSLNQPIYKLTTLPSSTIQSWITALHLPTCPGSFTLALKYTANSQEPKIDNSDRNEQIFRKVKQVNRVAFVSLLSDIHEFF